MLEELEIRALGPLEHAVVTPAAGMTAITGETGAGKSMLLNALGLISGQPANARMVKPGQDQAWAQGIFAFHKGISVEQTLVDAGVDMSSVEADGLFISRNVPSHGRSRAVVNGRSVPRSVLESISEQLLTIHGQSDQLTIAHPGAQREFIDSCITTSSVVRDFAEAWHNASVAREQYERVRDASSASRARADYLRESIDHITAVNPHIGEDDELKALRSRIEHAADIARAVQGALQALDGDSERDEQGAVSLVDGAVHALRTVHIAQPFEQLADRLQSASSELSDIAYTLSSMEDEEVNGQDLDSINARIHELDGLTRRWGPELTDVLQWKEKAQFELEDLDDSPERLTALRSAYDEAMAEALQYAQQLHEQRVLCAEALSTYVTHELHALAMSGSSLHIEVTAHNDRLDSTGIDTIEFIFKPFPQSPGLRMGQSASGGELSRLMLALELAAVAVRTDNATGTQHAAAKHMQHNHTQQPYTDGDTTPYAQTSEERYQTQRLTFVFDEVDAGVGGRAAVELGKRLARLAQQQQVIVVTHLPQVAAWADTQYVVQKHLDESGVSTQVVEVAQQQREEEIARMLDGGISDSSLAHARELLAQCQL